MKEEITALLFYAENFRIGVGKADRSKWGKEEKSGKKVDFIEERRKFFSWERSSTHRFKDIFVVVESFTAQMNVQCFLSKKVLLINP